MLIRLKTLPFWQWLSVSFVFGIGIVLAGGCATGTWYRAAEGLVGSWVALFTYMLLSAIMRTGPLGEFNKTLRSINIEQRNILRYIRHFTLVVSGIINFSDGFLCVQTSQQTKRKSRGIKTKENRACPLIIWKTLAPIFLSRVNRINRACRLATQCRYGSWVWTWDHWSLSQYHAIPRYWRR